MPILDWQTISRKFSGCKTAANTVSQNGRVTTNFTVKLKNHEEASTYAPGDTTCTIEGVELTDFL
jgi:hypothetical protein